MEVEVKTIGVVLCGLGRMGMIHVKNIMNNRNVTLLYIVEMDLEKAYQLIKENALDCTKVVHVDDVKTALDDVRVSAVVICTPTDTHESFVLQSLEAGKNVLCEKPLSVKFDAVSRCYEIAQNKGLVLLCAFNRRFDPQIRKMYSSKERIGKLHSVKICSRDSPRPSISYLKISGGIFHDCIIHDMDMIRYFVGENPATIYTVAHCHDPEIAALDDVDTVFVVLQFPSGVIAHIDISRECVYGYDQTIQLFGTKGNMVSSNPRKSALELNGGQSVDEILFSFPDRYASAYALELQHLVDLIQKKDLECYVKASDTIQATLLSQAAEDSFREKRVIEVKPYMQKMYEKYKNDYFVWQ